MEAGKPRRVPRLFLLGINGTGGWLGRVNATAIAVVINLVRVDSLRDDK